MSLSAGKADWVLGSGEHSQQGAQWPWGPQPCTKAPWLSWCVSCGHRFCPHGVKWSPDQGLLRDSWFWSQSGCNPLLLLWKHPSLSFSEPQFPHLDPGIIISTTGGQLREVHEKAEVKVCGELEVVDRWWLSLPTGGLWVRRATSLSGTLGALGKSGVATP